jgi:hypothetical protein
MNTIRVQARLALGALLTAVLVLTVSPATSSAAPSTSSGTDARAAAPVAKAPATATPDARRDCYRPRCYGAIAMNMRTLKTFGGWNYGSRYLAERSQYKRCTRNTTRDRYCKKIVWVKNGCAAVGWKDKPDSTGAYWYAYATGYRTAYAAKRAVRKKLNFGSAQVLQWICTSRQY